MPANYIKEQLEAAPGYEGADVELGEKELFSPATALENAPEPKPLERDDEIRGTDEPLYVLEDEFDPTWSYESRAYPDLAGFRLTQVLGEPETTEGDGIILDPDGDIIPEGAFRHVWEAPHGKTGPSPQTVDVLAAYVAESTFVHISGCGAEELNINSGEAGGVKLKANGPALFWETVDDPSETAVAESLAVRPFMRADATVVTWQGEERNIENLDVTVHAPIAAEHSLGVASEFPDLLEYDAEGPHVVSFSVPKRHLTEEDLAALTAAQRFSAKIRWRSKSLIPVPVGSGSGSGSGEEFTTYPYTLWLIGDGAQYTGGGPASLENKRRIGAEYQGRFTSDGSGASSTFTLVNASPSYAAPTGSGSGS